MNMIDEVVNEDDASDNSNGVLKSEDASSDLEMMDESFNDWNLVSDRNERTKKLKATINLKDITETHFLELIEAKNQDKRFFGWLNFQPLF